MIRALARRWANRTLSEECDAVVEATVMLLADTNKRHKETRIKLAAAQEENAALKRLQANERARYEAALASQSRVFEVRRDQYLKDIHGLRKDNEQKSKRIADLEKERADIESAGDRGSR